MRKIALVLLFSLPLFAGFFPQTVHTSVTSITKNSLKLQRSFPVNGMSGVVIHRYSDTLKAITNRIIQTKSAHATVIKSDIIHHNRLPTINTAVKNGDKVIGGYLYENVLLLAPDAQTYAKISSKYNKNWIHPDVFALFLTKEGDNIPTKENLKKFAKSHQVGLVYIVAKGKAKLLDPISGYIVGQKTMTNLPSKGQAPFFMRFNEIESGLFSSNNQESYYNIMGKI